MGGDSWKMALWKSAGSHRLSRNRSAVDEVPRGDLLRFAEGAVKLPRRALHRDVPISSTTPYTLYHHGVVLCLKAMKPTTSSGLVDELLEMSRVCDGRALESRFPSTRCRAVGRVETAGWQGLSKIPRCRTTAEQNGQYLCVWRGGSPPPAHCRRWESPTIE